MTEPLTMPEVEFDPDDLTWDQAIFLSDFTGRSVPEIQTMIESESYTPRDLLAVLAIALDPDDPAAKAEDLRHQKIEATVGD